MISFLHAQFLLAVLGQAPDSDGSAAGDLLKGWPPADVQSPMVFRVLSALVFVIFLIFLFAFVARRYFRMGTPRPTRGKMRIVDSLPLGGRRMVQVIKVHDRYLVIGVTSNKIDLLTELAEEEVPAPAESVERVRGGFGAIFPLWSRKREAASGEVKPI